MSRPPVAVVTGASSAIDRQPPGYRQECVPAMARKRVWDRQSARVAQIAKLGSRERAQARRSQRAPAPASEVHAMA